MCFEYKLEIYSFNNLDCPLDYFDPKISTGGSL